MNLSYCRSCNACIVWVETETGKKMPLDHAAVLSGNIILVNRLAHVIKASEVVPEGTPRFKSHFATCVHAKQHRKKAS
jgi:hypothetical protein